MCFFMKMELKAKHRMLINIINDFLPIKGFYENGRVKEFPIHNVLLMAALQDDILTHNLHHKCKRFKGCIAQDKTLVQTRDTFVYLNSNNEVWYMIIYTSTQSHLY